ncbi:MAG: hypothetical protein E5X92_28935, partial [Mesorhizobium sp.]
SPRSRPWRSTTRPAITTTNPAREAWPNLHVRPAVCGAHGECLYRSGLTGPACMNDFDLALRNNRLSIHHLGGRSEQREIAS